MKKHLIIYSILLFLISGCAHKFGAPSSKSRNPNGSNPQSNYEYKYSGNGHFVEFSRTYIPGIAVTYGYVIDLQPFTPNKNISRPYFLEVLPKQIETLYIDLALVIPPKVISPAQEIDEYNKIPSENIVRCALFNSDTREIIASTDMPVKLFARNRNRMLRRNYIINLLEIEPNSIPEGTGLEIKFEYIINDRPVDHEMMLLVSMNPPTA